MNPEIPKIINEINESRENFRKLYLDKGEAFTRGYLSAYGPIRKFLAEQGLSNESNRYHGAKSALEQMAGEK